MRNVFKNMIKCRAIKLFSLFLICLTLYVNKALAKGMYLKIGLGKIQYAKFGEYINKTKTIYENNAPKGNITYNLGIGYGFTNCIRADLNFQQDRIRYKAGDGSDYDGSDGYHEDILQTIVVHTIFLNGYYDFNFFKNIAPYLTGGIGITQNKASDFADAAYKLRGTTQKNLVWNVGAGMKYNLNKKFALDFMYRYINLSYIKTTSDSALFVAGKQALKGHQIILALIYNFC